MNDPLFSTEIRRSPRLFTWRNILQENSAAKRLHQLGLEPSAKLTEEDLSRWQTEAPGVDEEWLLAMDLMASFAARLGAVCLVVPAPGSHSINAIRDLLELNIPAEAISVNPEFHLDNGELRFRLTTQQGILATARSARDLLILTLPYSLRLEDCGFLWLLAMPDQRDNIRKVLVRGWSTAAAFSLGTGIFYVHRVSYPEWQDLPGPDIVTFESPRPDIAEALRETIEEHNAYATRLTELVDLDPARVVHYFLALSDGRDAHALLDGW